MDWLIKKKAEELADGVRSTREGSQRVAEFARDHILYSLDEWNVPPDEVLRRGRGMCAGKALLASELHRALGIPTRFKVIKIVGEEGILDFVARRLAETECSGITQEDKEKVIDSILSLPPGRDHIIVQVLLDGAWVDLDPARDKEMEYGMKVLGIWKERQVLSEEEPFDSIDGWLQGRMKHRAVVQNREMFFHVVNQQIDKVRLAGVLALKAGIQVWSADEIRESLRQWEIVSGHPLNGGVSSINRMDELAKFTHSHLLSIPEPQARSAMEEKIVDWLYILIRHHVKGEESGTFVMS